MPSPAPPRPTKRRTIRPLLTPPAIGHEPRRVICTARKQAVWSIWCVIDTNRHEGHVIIAIRRDVPLRTLSGQFALRCVPPGVPIGLRPLCNSLPCGPPGVWTVAHPLSSSRNRLVSAARGLHSMESLLLQSDPYLTRSLAFPNELARAK